MPDDRGAESPSDALEQARRIHRICEDFERRWRDNDPPRIEDFLRKADHRDRARLLEELLPLELELRHRRGDTPSFAEYVARFPEDAGRIAAAFSLTSESLTTRRQAAVDPNATPRPDEEMTHVLASGTVRDNASSSNARTSLDLVGDYEVLEEIARGGMGVVYKAKQRSLKRPVALKMILAGQMATADQRERFLREAELAANLDHPNIVPIFEVAEHQGCPYFSMKLIEGVSLSARIKTQVIQRCTAEPKAIARLLMTIARAVQYAHERGFLHCDLKPSNILLDREGRPHITDFGLAKRASEDSSQTVSGAILGSPSYMAPEQAAGMRRTLSRATDVYGLGAILYELLTGRPPFRAETVMETVVQVLERDPAPPRELCPEVPKELETICLKCLEKAPGDRYASASELADELERYLKGEVIDTTSLLPRLRRWNRREPELVARLGGLALIAAITQFNYVFLSPNPDFLIHYTVQAVLAGWAASAVSFQWLLRSGWRSDRVRALYSAADVLFLTLELKLLGRVETTLLVGYPILIAASGLWWRVNLVWITTLIATLSYFTLYLDASVIWREGPILWRPRSDLQYPNIFIAGLLLTGYIVARQVHRILALSHYYENRPGA